MAARTRAGGRRTRGIQLLVGQPSFCEPSAGLTFGHLAGVRAEAQLLTLKHALHAAARPPNPAAATLVHGTNILKHAAVSDDPAELVSPRLKRLYQDWLARRRGRLMPARSDFDILDLAYMLGDLNLIEVLREPLRFRFRVHATNATNRLGFDLTGRTIDDYPDPTYRAFVDRHYRSIVATRLPARVHFDPFVSRDHVIRWEGLILPLAADGETVDMMMGGLDMS
jgi:hypothetical protein